MATNGPADGEKIEYAELEEMLGDIDVPDREIAKYLVVNDELSEPFDPAIEVDWSKVEQPPELALEGAVAVAFLNHASRQRRRKKYQRKIKGGFSGIKIVSEGDSWFQYPFLLKDVIDHLSDQPDFAIRSLGAAGDLLADMIKRNEFTEVIEEESPKFFLISGGGNDLVGDERLASMVHEFASDLETDQYPNSAFTQFEAEIAGLYSNLFTLISQRFPDLHVLCHGYDYAIPADGKWLGNPLKQRNIVEKTLQANIVRVVIDRFNSTLSKAASGFPKVHYVNCRDAVSHWHDELHPKDDDYGHVAQRFADIVRSL